MVSGMSSWPGVMSCLNIVRKLQDCPPRNDVGLLLGSERRYAGLVEAFFQQDAA
jgi:hypothetical protein